MRKIISAIFVFILIFSGVARADTSLSAAGAVDLEKQIGDELEWRNDMAKAFGQGLTSEGKVEVKQESGFYEVHLPHLAMLAGPQGKLDIGPVILNIAPAPEAGAWLVQQATLPSTMTYYNAKNEPAVHITIGSQKFSGVWLPGKDMYPKVDALLKNIEFKGIGDGAATGKIAALKTLIDLKDNGDNTWSGNVDFEAAGAALDAPGKNPVAISLGAISSRSVYDRLDLSQSLKLKETARKALKEKLPQTEAEKRAFVAKLLTQYPSSAAGITGDFEVDKILAHDTGTPQQPRRDFALDRIVFSVAAGDARQEKGKLALKAALDGLHVSVVPPLLADLMPRTLNAEITFDNLPTKKITDQLFAIVQKSAVAQTAAHDPAALKEAKDKANAEASANAALLPKLLQDAGASASVHNTYLKSDILGASLEGKIDAVPGAALGAAGKMTVTFKGLDEAVQKMQVTALTPGADPQALGYAAAMTAVQMKGTPDKAADGTSLRNFIFELKKNGDILLNGVVVNPRVAPVAMPHTQPMMPAPVQP